MQPGKVNFWGVLVTGVGAVLAVGGALIAVFWPDIYVAIIDQEMMIQPESRIFNNWKETSIPLYFDIYIFNWTNPEEFTTKGKKPNLVELGPYRFYEKKKKVNIVMHPENGTVSYDSVHYWEFVEEMSSGTLDDEVTMLNVIAASAVYRAREWDVLRQTGVSLGFNMFNHEVSVTQSVRKLLFDGYQDPLLDFSNTLPDFMTGGAPRVDRFGWFYGRNGSTAVDGHMNVATGTDGPNAGQIRQWNFMNTNPYHKGQCAELKGSTGEFFPRNLKPDEDMYLFSTDLCRALPLQFQQREEFYGVDVMKYIAGDKAIDNGTKYPENKCYCDGECHPSGVMNLSSCRFGSPTFVSFPHFYLADSSYRDAVEGMNPDEKKHSFYMALEPTFGVPLEVAARFQINILVKPNPTIKLFENVPTIYMPVMWFEQYVKMSEEVAAQLSGATKMGTIGSILAICVAVTGVAIAAIAPATSYNRRKRRTHLEKKLTEEASFPLNGGKV